MTAYRTPTEPEATPPDPETAAFAAIALRVRRVRLAVVFPLLLLGIVFGVVAHVWVRGALLGSVGGQVPAITGAVTVAPFMACSWRAATWLSRLIVSRRKDAWVAELAAKHGLPAETIEPFVRAMG